MRRFVVQVPPSSADRPPIVGMVVAGVVCAAVGFFLVRWVGGPAGDDSDPTTPALAADEGEGASSGDPPTATSGQAGEDEPSGHDEDAASAAQAIATAEPDAATSAPVANANAAPDAPPAPGTVPTPAPSSAPAASGPTAGRIAYVRCEIGTQNPDGTWPPCPRFREIELAAARAVPRLAGCPGLAQATRGFDVRILYRRARPRPSFVVVPSNAPWAETVAACVRERFTGMPDGSAIEGNVTIAVRVQVGAGASGTLAAAPTTADAIEPPPPEPATPVPAAGGAPTPAAASVTPEPPAPPGAGPDGASADYRALARPRQGTVRSGAILRAQPRDGTLLERPSSDERVEILGFDRGWVHVRWRGRTAWVFQTWMAQ